MTQLMGDSQYLALGIQTQQVLTFSDTYLRDLSLCCPGTTLNTLLEHGIQGLNTKCQCNLMLPSL